MTYLKASYRGKFSWIACVLWSFTCRASKGLVSSHLCFSRSAAHLGGKKRLPATLSSRQHDAPVTCHTLWSTLVSVFDWPTSCQLPLLRSEALSPGRKQQTAEDLWHKTLDEFVFLMCHREPCPLAQLSPFWTFVERHISADWWRRSQFHAAIVEDGRDSLWSSLGAKRMMRPFSFSRVGDLRAEVPFVGLLSFFFLIPQSQVIRILKTFSLKKKSFYF